MKEGVPTAFLISCMGNSCVSLTFFFFFAPMSVPCLLQRDARGCQECQGRVSRISSTFHGRKLLRNAIVL